MLKQLSVVAGIGTALFGALVMSGCAKEEFRKQQFTASASAVGFRYLPAKVDILMVADNTGSINNIFSTVQAQLAGFAGGMQEKFWDYHVGRSPIIPMTSPPRITRVLVNPKYNVNTLPDGTPAPNVGLVPADRAETNPGNFPILENVQASGSGDDTYINMIAALNNARTDTYTNFLRQDAMLAVVIFTNGYDRNVTTETGALVSSGAANLQHYANQILAIKGGNSSLVRFYPVAAYGYKSGSGSDYCLTPGGTSRPGNSYFLLSSYLQGISTNVCDSSALSNVLANIEANLEIARQSYVYSNIVLDEQPVPGSIELYKNGQKLPESTSDGWQYRGFQTNVCTVTHIRDDRTGTLTELNPCLNRRTGYTIQLNGSARMVGSDTPDITYDRM